MSGLIDKDGYIVLLSLSRSDVASHLVSNTPMEEAEADRLAATLTDDELESIAERMQDNEAFMDDFWMTLEYAIGEEAPRLLKLTKTKLPSEESGAGALPLTPTMQDERMENMETLMGKAQKYGDAYIAEDTPRGRTVAIVKDENYLHVLAAAPDMLRALEKAAHELKSFRFHLSGASMSVHAGMCLQHAERYLSDAIDKAKGE